MSGERASRRNRGAERLRTIPASIFCVSLRYCRVGKCKVAGRVVTIADTYRAMSEDIRRAAEEIKIEDVRRAYLALAELWWARAMHLDGALSTAPAKSEP